MQKHFEALSQRHMTRREFLRNVGLVTLSIIGVGRFIKYLDQPGKTPSGPTRGYGRNSFGGRGRKAVKAQSKT